ncbi:MAG: hypothetical protein KIS92_01975 [Planctomycetota bacterium]|nr:hypothetical protein [Planctomycetota bacterium]
MNTITLDFERARIDIGVIEQIVYIRVFGVYTDDVAHALIARLDKLLEHFPGDPIRITDVRGVPADQFKLTAACIDRISKWGAQVKARYPNSIGYLIGHTALSYGMARMYALKTEVEPKNIVVLSSFEELPLEIRVKLPQ